MIRNPVYFIFSFILPYIFFRLSFSIVFYVAFLFILCSPVSALPASATKREISDFFPLYSCTELIDSRCLARFIQT